MNRRDAQSGRLDAINELRCVVPRILIFFRDYHFRTAINTSMYATAVGSLA